MLPNHRIRSVKSADARNEMGLFRQVPKPMHPARIEGGVAVFQKGDGFPGLECVPDRLDVPLCLLGNRFLVLLSIHMGGALSGSGAVCS